MRRLGTLAVLALASLGMAQTKIGNCEVTGPKGQFPIRPAIAGQLTVQTNLPGPGFWNGDSPATIKDGFEYCLAAYIAHRAGLDKLVVQNVAWDALIAGQTRNFDFALSQITITEARKRVVDFSRPYFSSDIGVLVRSADKGKFSSPASLKTARIGVQQATTAAKFLSETLKHPQNLTRVFPDVAGGFTALRAGQIDAFVIDTSIVLSEAAKSGGALVVVGQFQTGENYGALFTKGNPNRAQVDRILEALEKEGVLKKLAQTYLAKEWGVDPTSVPIWKP
ncbi:L-cystine-binding protein FliY [Meiothermus luteus]|uniref:L-cystine-binding protein FliY n=1 Tax=Meiothermus luteus TaxID=2026184 RepID=A0A399F3Z1_9DEIN|nr:ABC transporter substrate-binding protein [Meiothermus luteus]RIH89969.1 L-cystine-binding protein FliY [Meiothermus luteus]RMH57901.1 MAG: amino acid ABC transporter substrate-binding protein [Deinococcota bacterium]